MINTKYICTNKTKVFDRALGTFVYYDCGKCPSCLQRINATRAKSVDDQLNVSKYNDFLTLTYDDEHIPLATLYKECVDRINIVYEIGFVTTCDRFVTPDGETQVTLYRQTCTQETDKYCVDLLKLRSPFAKYDKNSIPILNYYDVKCFFKRFRKAFTKWCQENQIDEPPFKYYVLSEYGGKYFRPHYHILFHSDSDALRNFLYSTITEIPKETEQEDQRFNSSLWQFGNVQLNVVEVSETSGISGYLSGYMQSAIGLPDFFKHPAIRCKVRHSNNYGKALAKVVAPMFKNLASLSPEEYVNATALFNEKIVRISESYAVNSELYRQFPHFSTLSDNVAARLLAKFERAQINKDNIMEVIKDTSVTYYNYLQNAFEHNNRNFAIEIKEMRYPYFVSSLFYRWQSAFKQYQKHHYKLAPYKYVMKLRKVYSLLDYRNLYEFLCQYNFLAKTSGCFPNSLYRTTNINDVFSRASETYCKNSLRISMNRKKHNEIVNYHL